MRPASVIDEIRRRRESGDTVPGLNVYWVRLSDDRDEFEAEFRQLRGEWPIAPWILRTPGVFLDPNAVMNDVVDVLENARNDIVGMAAHAQNENGIDLVLLSRTELRLAITSSPILLPNWFPVMPGQTVTARINDLTWSVRVSVSDGVAACDEIQRILHELDLAMVDRLRDSQRADHRRIQALWAAIRRESDLDVGSTLASIRTSLGEIRNPNDFRPSTMRNPTVVGRIWHLANKTPPDGLRRKAKALADALRASELRLDEGVDDSLLVVLNRPAEPIRDEEIRWCFQLIVTLRSACQMVTAAAHADEYPRFPDVLLRATSLDLRRFLDRATRILRTAAPCGID